MKLTALTHRPIAILVCAMIVASSLPQPTMAGDTKERVQVKIGKPSVWSLAQAHYLLASMHKKNAGIELKAIASDALDPNAANATRLQILRTILGVQAEFNQKVGAENQSKLREEQVKLKRRSDAQVELAAKEEDLRAEKARLNGLKKQLAALQETDRQREEERKAESDAGSKRDSSGKITEQKFIPLTEDDENRKIEIVKLQQKVNTQQAKVDGLNNEVTALNTAANADVAPPSLTDTTFTERTIALPSPSTSLQTLIDKTLAGAGKPSLAASIALDNYIGMQYEIIAKQLTLLRDEIGPDDRVIFLELPSSIYTVPCKSEDYIVQVHWKVTQYYRDKYLQIPGLDECEPKPNAKPSERGSESGKQELKKDDSPRDYTHTSLKEMKEARITATMTPEERAKHDRDRPQCKYGWIPLKEDSSVRALDIVPRQSALNVNDFHATVSQKNFLGVLKLLSGFGVKVDYQRQRELYEEFLQQEVFASGFGKGRQDFGWTFGPLPGTNRVAPGQRTTYAVLAVPHDASGIHLEATAIAYKRTKTPNDQFDPVNAPANSQIIATDVFDVAVPNQQTEGFDVRGIAYTPVQAGSPVTVVLEGISFSPQINVFVENTPLTRVLNFGSKESAELKPGSTDSNIKGFFELVNSREMMLTFTMGDNAFVGTPNITLVTPEKTSSINFYPLTVNNRRSNPTKLRDNSLTEPMFMTPFSLTGFEVTADSDPAYLKARLTGTGLRRSADIWINDTHLDSKDPDTPPASLSGDYAQQESTTAYNIRFLKGGGPTWNLRFRQRTVRGFEEKSMTQQFPPVSKPFEIRHYIPNASGANAEVDLRFFNSANSRITKVEIHRNEGTYPTVEGCSGQRRPPQLPPCGQFEEDAEKYRARFLVFPHILGSHKLDRDTITVTIFKDVTDASGHVEPKTVVKDILLPVRPQISKIVNPATGKPAGYADQEVTAIIEGANLDAIKKIFFGTQRAEIVGVTDNDSAIVKVPKLADLPKGESVTVPITVEMKSDFYEGKTLTAGYYKYVGQPLPIDVGEPVPVVVRPPRYKVKPSKGGN